MLNIRSPSYQRAKAQSYGRDRDTDKELYAPVTVAKAWKQLECPLTEEWIKKMWCINTMEYYSAIKNEIMPFVAISMNLETVILSEVNQKEKEKYHDIPFMWNLKRNELTKQK